MSLEMIRKLYDYNTWANRQVFETAAQLSPQQFADPVQINFGSLRESLFHLVTVEEVWITRAQGLSKPNHDDADFPDLPSLRDLWERIDRASHAYLATLKESDLTTIIHYVNNQGVPNAYPLWEILFHQANHAGQHRAEMALIMTGLGCSTGWLDYLIFVDQTREGR